MAGGLRSAPLLTVTAPHLPWHCIGIPAQGDRRLWAGGAAKTLEDGTGASGPRGRLAEMRPARPSRAQKGAVGARRVASASRPHLGHHFLELALRHRHGGHLAAPVPVGRGSAAPGPPQAAPHNRTPSSQPPTPPPLTTGSRPPRRPFRFLHVTSEVST